MENEDLENIGAKINSIRQDPTMYTLQKNSETREHQKKLWMHIIFHYCFINHIYTVTVTDLQNSDVAKHPDKQSNRSLKHADLEEIMEFMKEEEYAQTSDNHVFIISGKNRMNLIADGLTEWAREDPLEREQMLIADIHDDEKFQTIPVDFLVKVAEHMDD